LRKAKDDEEAQVKNKEDAEEIAFEDLEEDEEDDDDESVSEDFETKAEKMRQRMMEIGRLADEEERDDMRLRQAKPTPLQDAEEEAQAGEQLHGLRQDHSAEELRDRVKETLRVLSHFKDEREDGHERAEYLSLLRGDLREIFEYNDFLMDCVMNLFAPAEAFEFLEAMDKVRPTTIRANTIRTNRRDLVQALTKRGMNIEPLEKWSKVGLQVFESNVPIAGTVEYLAGHYMLQSAVSFLPVMALAPRENERILDMAAAPGGKTTYIAQLMKNSGVLFANDVSEPRIKALNANIQRLGVTNCIVTCYDGVGYNKVMGNFDRVLLDAPCTGSGIISRDMSIKTSKRLEDVQRASLLQRKLLLSAIDCCKAGGIVVYSTCSFLVEENEAVVNYAMEKREVEVLDMGLPFGRPGLAKYRHHRFDPSIEYSRRFFPHVHNMDGFFVCTIRVLAKKLQGSDEEVRDALSAPPRGVKRMKQRHANAENGTAAPAGSSFKTKRQQERRARLQAAREAMKHTDLGSSKALKVSVPPPRRPKAAASGRRSRANEGAAVLPAAKKRRTEK
jgi:ribosomal RNA methyltransferase Nop2